MIRISSLILLALVSASVAYSETAGRRIVLVVTTSSAPPQAQDLLIGNLKRAIFNLHANADRALDGQADFLKSVAIEHPSQLDLPSIDAYYDMWRDQKLLEIVEPSIYLEPPGSQHYKSKTRLFLGDLTKKYKYVADGSFMSMIDIDPQLFDKNINANACVTLLALLLDRVQHGNASPQVASYLVMTIDNNLADLRKGKETAEVHDLVEHISAILTDVKNNLGNASPSSQQPRS